MGELVRLRKRLLYLSSVAVPHQVAFNHALQDYFEAEHWFYESAEQTRGAWWDVDLGPYCRILPHVIFAKNGPLGGRYIAPTLLYDLDKFDPDILVLGGFSIPSNYAAYLWGRRRKRKVVVFSERSRNANGVLRTRSLIWRILRTLYGGVDLVMVSADDAVGQFRDELGFGEKVVAGRYAADIDQYLNHPPREPKAAYTYLFANRLTPLYNPLGCILIFAKVLAQFPGSRLLINAAGEQAAECRSLIRTLQMENAVEFLTDLRSWSDLNEVYARSDVLLLPATFSNGNFTILEAMASGMGLVVSDRVMGIGKLVRDGHNGFNCRPTADEFVERINRYVTEPELLKAHAHMNREIVKPYSAQATAEFFYHTLKQRLHL